MPSVEDNRSTWGREYGWHDGGDEWSGGWGGPSGQWYGWLLPRLQACLGGGGPAPFRVRRAVEIGCGHGRWTAFLVHHADELVALDVAASCVEACRERFAGVDGVRCATTDGASLPGLAERSVALVFSFDSLVHADADAVEGYVGECARVLDDDGVAVLHHSNLGDALPRLQRGPRPPAPVRRALGALGCWEPDLHWRDPGVSAAGVAAAATRHGLSCVAQELLPWSTRRALIDCVSVLVRPGSVRDRPLRRVESRGFAAEASAATSVVRLYGGDA